MSKAAKQSSICAGWHAVEAVLARRPEAVQQLLLGDQRDGTRAGKLEQAARQAGVPVQRVARQRLDELAPGVRHQGLLALITPAQAGNINDLEASLDAAEARGEALFVLVLDQVQDPHNLGALLRTADAAAVTAVIVPADRAASLTPAARKAAAGAAETVPLFQVTNLARALKSLQARGIWLHGLAGEAEQSLYQADLTGHTGIVLGAEGTGLRKRTRELCDGLWKLPMHGSVESLNVSATGAIVLYEALRQRGGLSR